ncbi:hypothetical protein [Methanospirillum hungatei]|uniref:hypothetical protein n=1 Tax=Methanospirillum hungatei TaxID=2203 RepID=UPI0026ED5DB8|nr:hypothetical protein [Methanospirillum hungatei]MCA1917293.1 hypothetical protein [Methanospirillum hungatei]
MLLAMIRSVAAIFQFQRERTELDGGGYRIDATVKDFHIARELFAALDNVSGSVNIQKKTMKMLEEMDLTHFYWKSQGGVVIILRCSGQV